MRMCYLKTSVNRRKCQVCHSVEVKRLEILTRILCYMANEHHFGKCYISHTLQHDTVHSLQSDEWSFARCHVTQCIISHQCKYICTVQVFFTNTVNFVLFWRPFYKIFLLEGGLWGGGGGYIYFYWVGGINVNVSQWAMV